MCKNMERENSHLCQHTPAQSMNSHAQKYTQNTHMHTCMLTPLFHCHDTLCDYFDITTLYTTTAWEKLVE